MLNRQTCLFARFHRVILSKRVKKDLYIIAQSIEVTLKTHGWSVATAESCTGGGIAASLTAVPGSSTCVKGGIVAYTEEIKMRLLDVSSRVLQTYGVVSQRTVEEMARGAMKTFDSDFAVATSGVAGPSGGSEDIPVGTIWIAVASRSQMETYCVNYYNEGRDKNTQNAIVESLKLLQKVVENEENQVKK